MSLALLDDHLLAASLVGAAPPPLTGAPLATTNLFYVRLCRSAAAQEAAPSPRLRSWAPGRRSALRRQVVALPASVHVVPMAELAWPIAELVQEFGLSTLGGECVAAAQHLSAGIWVWEGNDGPRVRAAAEASGVAYQPVAV